MCGKLSLQTFFSMSYISIWPGTFAKKEVIYETAEYNNFFQKTSWRQLDSLFITIFNNKLLSVISINSGKQEPVYTLAPYGSLDGTTYGQ